jgi:peptide/nickel transport system substrate-binding protein
MYGGRNTMEFNMYDEWFPNPMVMRDGNMPEIRDNADGSRTYTFEIYTENRFSDGNFITAEHYAGGIALGTSPQWGTLVPAITGAPDVMGRDAWRDGETDTLVGVRLYSPSRFSVTVPADRLPMIWEMQMYMNWGPTAIHELGVEAHDDGNGVFITGPGRSVLTAEALGLALNGGSPTYRVDRRQVVRDGENVYDDDGNPVMEDWVRTDLPPIGGDGVRFNPQVFSGPYMFHSVDVGTGHLQVEANPYFEGTWDGFRPRIKYIIWRQVPDPVLIDALEAGEVHMTVGQGQGAIINNALARLVGLARTHDWVRYDRPGFGLIQFHTDHGPTQFTAVRQAMMWLIDRDVFGEMFTEGHGSTAHGPYANSWWWTQEARDRGMYDRFIHYTLNVAEAIRLLEADGWNYTATGDPFVGPGDGADHIRHKWVDGELMPLIMDWATFTDPNRITEIINVLLPAPMAEAGFRLNEVRYAAPTSIMSQGAGAAVRYNMFNLGLTFGRPWAPWLSYQMTMGPAWNWGQVDIPAVTEATNRIRYIEDPTGAGRDEFIDAFIEFMVVMNREVTLIPLYVDIWYDFIPTWIGDWNNSALWGFVPAIQRAYSTR